MQLDLQREDEVGGAMRGMRLVSGLLAVLFVFSMSPSEAAEEIVDVWLSGLPSAAGCLAGTVCLVDCRTDTVTVYFDYHTTDYPICYPTHYYIYEEDGLFNPDDSMEHYQTNLCFNSEYTYNWSRTFYGVNTGFETCMDSGGGEFRGRVWVESNWTDEEVSSSTYNVAPVRFSTFVVIPGNEVVEIRWETEEETEVAGFNVYKLEKQDNTGQFQRINENFISAGQFKYSFFDINVNNKQKYHYIIESIDLDSQRYQHGPRPVVPVNADLNLDGVINLSDLEFVAEKTFDRTFGISDFSVFDLNLDGEIDGADLAIFLDAFDLQYGVLPRYETSKWQTFDPISVDIDVDRNGTVDIADLFNITGSYMAEMADGNFRENADLDANGIIDRNDLEMFFFFAFPEPAFERNLEVHTD